MKFQTTEEDFILLKFLIFVYHNDLLANFRIDGKICANKLLNFISKIQHEDENDPVIKFLKSTIIEKDEPSVESIEKFESKLEILFDLFIQDLSSRKEFSEFKEDYFKI
jgi:hypothetical protein